MIHSSDFMGKAFCGEALQTWPWVDIFSFEAKSKSEKGKDIHRSQYQVKRLVYVI